MAYPHVTLVNRTSKPLNGTWDGRHWIIPVGRSTWPYIQALKFKLQNPQMGTADPRTGDVYYLCGIVEENDPIDPIEQTDAIEQWDRNKLPGGTDGVEVIPGRTGVHSARDVQGHLPTDTPGFVKP